MTESAAQVLAEALDGFAPNERSLPHYPEMLRRMAEDALSRSPQLTAALELGLRLVDENDTLLIDAVHAAHFHGRHLGLTDAEADTLQATDLRRALTEKLESNR